MRSPCRCHNNVKSASGATVIETVIFLPILLILVFFCYWLGVMSNTKAAFSVAVKEALYLAVTRSDPLTLNLTAATTLPSGSIPSVTTWINGSGSPQIDSLLYWNGSSYNLSSDPNYNVYYSRTNSNGVLRSIAPQQDLYDLPASYTYALIYIYQTMRQSVGDSIRYPCDPTPANPNDGAGCLLCFFDDPINPGSGNLFDPNVDPSLNPNYGPGNIAISCSFTPDTLIGNVLRALFRLVTGNSATPFVTLNQSALFLSSNGFIR